MAEMSVKGVSMIDLKCSVFVKCSQNLQSGKEEIMKSIIK